LLGLGGCANWGYYWQATQGHLQLARAARPVSQWLQDGNTPEPLKARLVLSQRMRDFAISELALPDNASYRQYADLQRRAVVWNVVAAAPDSLELKTWCFPLMGCVGYRGYFDEAAAHTLAQQLAQDNFEVSVYGVPAYSTLGWMNWAGGDPLLNTFMDYPEGELARMLFHELAHQVVYVADDTAFNESFATAVERLGAARWLASQATPVAQAQYEAMDAKRRAFRALTLSTRAKLRQIYAATGPAKPDWQTTLALKQSAMAQFRADYAKLKTHFSDPPAQWSGYDAWVARANNAAFASQGAYDDWVSAFEALYEQHQRNWPAFFSAVKQLAQRPKAERLQSLALLQAADKQTLELTLNSP
jgi:predicted aminopeptidase